MKKSTLEIKNEFDKLERNTKKIEMKKLRNRLIDVENEIRIHKNAKKQEKFMKEISKIKLKQQIEELEEDRNKIMVKILALKEEIYK